MDKKLIKISKFLSLVLRHKPEIIGLSINHGGWVRVEELLTSPKRAGIFISEETLQKVVEQNDKKRFSFSKDTHWIKANQGHSIPIDLNLEPLLPPRFLFHGTAKHYLESIRRKGLIRKKRHHVHLSPDLNSAISVGKRHGKPIALAIQAFHMHRLGFLFYRSDNNVWLTEKVHPKYIIFPEN